MVLVMNMKKILLVLFTMVLIFAALTHATSESIPANIWEFTTDYYDVIGEPGLSASLVGDNEYDAGDSATLFIQLMNDGLVFGFKTEETPSNADEIIDAQTELDKEYDVTTALNIRGTLENDNDAPVKILSGVQQGGSLREGEVSVPMEFDIEIFDNAPSGTYEFTLNLTYQYQYDVKVDGYPDQEYDYWYITKNQTLPVTIIVKPKASFEVEDVIANTKPGDQTVLYITYKNVGDKTAEDVVGRISVVDPFSTTDDQAYIGTLAPGDSYQAKYRIKVDGNALPKTYGINTEVKFRDERGDIQISDVMKAPVKVYEDIPFSEKVGNSTYMLVVLVIAGAMGLYYYKRRGRTE
ncbi:MAG: hypothetical protein C5S43_00980 [Candidatus Methanocomedens sp.]|nr:MAG: hypothetical protein C5S43_00980 [ANME-2 cluster archaeon]